MEDADPTQETLSLDERFPQSLQPKLDSPATPSFDQPVSSHNTFGDYPTHLDILSVHELNKSVCARMCTCEGVCVHVLVEARNQCQVLIRSHKRTKLTHKCYHLASTYVVAHICPHGHMPFHITYTQYINTI